MITIEIQDERGQVEAQFDDPEILEALIEKATPETKCLQFIDLYGDTTFNRHQVVVLVTELEDASAGLPVPSRDRAKGLIAFIGRAASEIRTYVKFIGD